MIISLLQKLTDDYPNDPFKDNVYDENSLQWLIDEINMLLTSRPRIRQVVQEAELNQSVLNYGLADEFYSDAEQSHRLETIRERIFQLMGSFEPRLKNVNVTWQQRDDSSFFYSIDAEYRHQKIILKLLWDDALSTFFLL